MSATTGQSAIGRVMTGRTKSPVVNWLATNLWAIITALVVVVFFFGQRLETPAQKRDRIVQELRPFGDQITQITRSVESLTLDVGKLHEKIDSHDHQPGHQISVTRIDALEKTLVEVRADVKTLLSRTQPNASP